jgi:hypothetical protein
MPRDHSAKNGWMTNSPLAQEPIRRPQAFLPIGEAIQEAGRAVLRDHPDLIALSTEMAGFVLRVLGRDTE